MLTGRESLSRLVGKRRKFLPNRHSLLSSSIKGPSNPCQDNKDGATRFEAEGPSQRCLDGGIEISPPPGWVTCPVCGNAICGEDRVINSHLDTCLRRGTKRKWRQCNLPQINFCESTKVETCLHEEIDVQKSHKNNFASDKSCNLHSCFGIEQNDSRACKSFLDSESVSCNDGSAGNLIGNNTVDLPSSLLVNQLMKYEKSESSNDIYRMALKTFIVGHRFGDKIEFNSGQIITLSRDPNNVKDCNAIKVLSADSGDKLLGFLPRELAQYLSPLIDKYHLRFQGSVTSVPNCSMDAIPIQILCQFGMPFGEIECEDLQEVMSLWKSALCVAKSTENCPPNTARYQKNFTLLLQEVLRSYSYLFSYDEKIFLESFFSLPDDSQRLFIRLYTRKGPWFRMSSICYPEVFDCKQGIEGLSATGFVCLVGCVSELLDSDLKDIFNLLTVSEIREILCHLKKLELTVWTDTGQTFHFHADVELLKCNFGTRKQDFIALLLSSYADGSCPLLPKLVLEKTGTCIQISSRAESLAWRCERLFFLNGEQDLSAFLLVDLGIVRYPTYSCVVSKKIFSGRSDLLAYEEAIEVAQMMDQALDDNNAELVFQCMEISDSKMSNSSPKTTQPSTSGPFVTFFLCFSASWVYSKVVLLGVSFLERERRYGEAITLLRRLLINFTSDRRRGYWTLRLSIDLEHMGCLEESLSVAEKGLLDSCVCAGSRIALQRRVLRLGKPPRRWKIPSFSMSVQRKITEVHVQGRPLNCKVGEKNRFYGEDGEQHGVEQLALQYYAGEGGGWLGVHTESGIWLTIFGLLMWDIIFADVPDVFRTRFQTGPLDLETECFYEARENIIEPVLEKICNGMAEEMLIMSWESHFGTACRGVNWDKHSLSELRAAVTCIGGHCLASICRHLAQDYRSWSSGMPDLLLWRFQGDYRGEAKVVEVKGPRDRLSEQQRAWLLFLMDCGCNVEVCKVGYIPLYT